MTDLSPLLTQLRGYLQTQVPTMTDNISWVALGMVLCGITLSVLGAKFARAGLTTAGIVVGGLTGMYVARTAGYTALFGGLIGAGMLATVTFITFRLWVGVLTAAVFGSVALGTFGYKEVAPHVAEFQNGQLMPQPFAHGLDVLQSGDITMASTDSSIPSEPKLWLEKFWTFVNQRDEKLAINGQLIGLAAMFTGLFLGVIVVRSMAIVSTSILGTSIALSGVATLLAKMAPDAYGALQHRPSMLGMGIGGFFVTSLILQTLLTRKAPEKAEAGSGK